MLEFEHLYFLPEMKKTHTMEFFKATYINAWSENAVSFYMVFSVCFFFYTNLTLSVDMTLHFCLEKMTNRILVRNVQF